MKLYVEKKNGLKSVLSYLVVKIMVCLGFLDMVKKIHFLIKTIQKELKNIYLVKQRKKLFYNII